MTEDQPDAEHPRKRPTSDYVGFALIAALTIGLSVIGALTSQEPVRVTTSSA